ncbi:MAG TPA: chromate transporter [Candidatus Cloacimonadota bacterium]|nr:chromate transporter [Candidatus Cloacimonadota bacterium]
MLTMFLTFVKVGLFSFGGGYAILAMLQQEIVVKHGWLTASEFTDVVAISQMTPGPIAINAATFIGFKTHGILGSVLCTFGVILAPLCLMLILTHTYIKLQQKEWFKNLFKSLRLLSVGLIAAAMVLIGKSAFPDLFSVGVFVVCFLIIWRWKVNPIYMLLGVAAFGMVFG